MSLSTSTPNGDNQQRLRVDDQIKNPYIDQPMPEVGNKIGPNRVELLIGEGGTANVYKVWNEGLEVVRAVKVLKKALHQESRERFLTEAKIMADINHPNIVEIHNIGYIDQQTPFIEMEYVEGSSIRMLISKYRRIPLSAALSVAFFVGQALHYAHIKDYTLYGKVYHGLIHRDIKPDNIVISKTGLVKLMDFGVARPSEVSLHTVGSKIVGTLVYLSPEQLNGSSLDCRSDIFSLGAVLYEMITGCRAFPHKSLQELVQKKTRGEYPPITSLGLPLPGSVNKIIVKCMALKPENRYASAGEFCQDIFEAIHQVSVRPPQDIVSRFMANPASIPHWKGSSGILKKYLWPGIGLLVTLAIGILAALWIK